MKKHYDVIILGAGPAGTAAAYGLSAQKSVLVVENDLFGGTCPNRGCDPKKMLYSAVETRQRVSRMQNSGLTNLPAINWPALMAFKRAYTSTIPDGTRQGLTGAGIETFHGQATFLDDHHLSLDGQTVMGDTFILATGRRPRTLTIPGHQLLKTSTDFLDLDSLPNHITFVGAGLVTMELANIANEAGATVDIIHHNNRPLKEFPSAFVDELVAQMTTRGIHFYFDTSVTGVKRAGSTLTLSTNNQDFNTDLAIAGVGRIANAENLMLEKCGVSASEHGVQVDEFLRTNVPHIYAIGDVAEKSEPNLTPVASFEGRYVANLLTGQTDQAINYPAIPRILFGTTEIGEVGVSVQTAQQAPERYQITSFDLTHWYTYNRIRDQAAKAYVIRDRDHHQVVGFSILSSISEQLLNAFTVILNRQVTNDEIQRTIFAYPSQASDLQYLV